MFYSESEVYFLGRRVEPYGKKTKFNSSPVLKNDTTARRVFPLVNFRGEMELNNKVKPGSRQMSLSKFEGPNHTEIFDKNATPKNAALHTPSSFKQTRKGFFSCRLFHQPKRTTHMLHHPMPKAAGCSRAFTAQ